MSWLDRSLWTRLNFKCYVLLLVKLTLYHKKVEFTLLLSFFKKFKIKTVTLKIEIFVV